jgi:hypothetical protein
MCFISTMTMASLSIDLEICKQMFSYGAIKPLLNASNGDKTDDACMLAGVGCITQLCRIPEIALRLVQQGVVIILEIALHRHHGHNHQIMREKALNALGFLSKIDSLKKALCSDTILSGIIHEFRTGTLDARTTILQFLMNIHRRYGTKEREIALLIRDPVIAYMADYTNIPWKARHLCVKVFCVIYQEYEDRIYFAHQGFIESLLYMLQEKHDELQEAPLVAFLHFAAHPQLPWLLMRKGVIEVAIRLLYTQDVIIQELAIILLKVFLLYDANKVTQLVPTEKQYILKRDVYNPQLYGAEYGEMIQEYLQDIVENRRAQDYLIRQFDAEEVETLQLTKEELIQYQNTFMELDAECKGSLGVDELKMLMVIMGEEMDREEVEELLREYDTDKSGALEFKEFAIMMKGWKTRFGTGISGVINVATKRGAIGKSLRQFKKWWNQKSLEQGQVQRAKEHLQAQKKIGEELVLKYMPHERLQRQRNIELKLREEEPYDHEEDDDDDFFDSNYNFAGRKIVTAGSAGESMDFLSNPNSLQPSRMNTATTTNSRQKSGSSKKRSDSSSKYRPKSPNRVSSADSNPSTSFFASWFRSSRPTSKQSTLSRSGSSQGGGSGKRETAFDQQKERESNHSIRFLPSIFTSRNPSRQTLPAVLEETMTG